MRVILHSDLNNFYASVEELYNPELKDKFLAVCGSVEDRHGIVLAKNLRAKKMGIKTGMTLKEAFDLCPNLVTVEANFERYLIYSKKVKDIYRKYTDQIESFGIDEAWLDVTHSQIFGSGVEIADKIREEVRNLGLTCSIGVSFNKVFAKLGSDLKKPDATTLISYENFKEVVWSLSADEMLFVGRKTKQKLLKYNIKTIGDIARSDREFLTKNLGKWGDYLYEFANGLDNSPVKMDGENDMIKSVGNSMTCYRDLISLDDVKIMFSVLCDSVSARLLDYQIGRASTVTITIKDENLNSFTRQAQLEVPSVLSEDFYNLAVSLFIKNYDFKNSVRSLGVSVSNFSSGDMQTSLFSDEENYEKKVRLAKTVGGIRKKFGAGSLQKAIGLKDRKIARENPKDNHTIHPEGYFKK